MAPRLNLSPEQKIERELFAEEALARLLTVRRAAVDYAKRFATTYRHAEGALLKVRQRWEHEATQVDKETRRARVRQSVEATFRAAATKGVIAHNADGSVARNPDGTVVRTPNPDLKTMIRAMELISRLDGTLIQVHDFTAGGIAGLLASTADATPPPDAPPMGAMKPKPDDED